LNTGTSVTTPTVDQSVLREALRKNIVTKVRTAAVTYILNLEIEHPFCVTTTNHNSSL